MLNRDMNIEVSRRKFFTGMSGATGAAALIFGFLAHEHQIVEQRSAIEDSKSNNKGVEIDNSGSTMFKVFAGIIGLTSVFSAWAGHQDGKIGVTKPDGSPQRGRVIPFTKEI